jgi:hypothetical protein
MSYDIRIYHPTVRERVEAGEEMDGFEHPQFDAEAVSRFVKRLGTWGYQAESTSAKCSTFVKTVSENTIQVRVFATEIAISVPYRREENPAIFEALQDASEMVDTKHMRIFNPQEGKWDED